MAVRLALGETHLVKENKEYFEKEGVDISVLESAKGKGGSKGAEERSSTVILVKNLPYSTEAAELAKRFGAFGDVSTVACIEDPKVGYCVSAFRHMGASFVRTCSLVAASASICAGFLLWNLYFNNFSLRSVSCTKPSYSRVVLFQVFPALSHL